MKVGLLYPEKVHHDFVRDEVFRILKRTGVELAAVLNQNGRSVLYIEGQSPDDAKDGVSRKLETVRREAVHVWGGTFLTVVQIEDDGPWLTEDEYKVARSR